MKIDYILFILSLILLPFLSFSQEKISEFYQLDSSLAVRLNFTPDNHNMILIIYKNNEGKWMETQTIDSLSVQMGPIKPDYKDYNCDNLKDLRVYYCSGGRGGNQYYYIFLKDQITNQFSFLKGSNSIPNINKDCSRDVLQGIALTASTDFMDYKIKVDSLVEVGGVEVSTNHFWTYRKYYRTLESGKRHIFKTDSIYDNGESLYERE